jgi:hypothetical protein
MWLSSSICSLGAWSAVEQATGLPAPGFDAVSRDEIPREQERVWAFDWYGIFTAFLRP